MRKPSLFGVVALLLWATPATGSAQDTQLRLYGEPTSFTEVIDAFDEGDPFDINVSLGFVRSRVAGTILRESNRAAAADGRDSQNFVDIAEHEHLRNTLEVGLDVGLYRDLALFARLPIVLSDTRELLTLDSAAKRSVALDALSVTEPDGLAEPLFSPAFKAPTRSGIEHLELGLAWALFNQYREPEVPTLVFMASGRFSLGEPMHACDVSSRFGDDASTASTEDLRCNQSDNPGISQGTNALRLETRASWRERYMEPYAGLAFDIAWPGSAGELFEPGGALTGFINTIPPRTAEMTVGVALIPWEHRGRWQRFVVDLRLVGAYVSEGHGYSPLFDALGTSDSSYLREPTLECPSCVRSVNFTGLTDMEAHGRVTARLGIEMQAAQHVRFVLGGELGYDTPYTLTYADACNPNVNPSSSDARQGTCRTGIINPHHRTVIDLPGNRFRVDGELTLDLFASAVAQF